MVTMQCDHLVRWWLKRNLVGIDRHTDRHRDGRISTLLPRDTMLARYVLSLCVCPSVSPWRWRLPVTLKSMAFLQRQLKANKTTCAFRVRYIFRSMEVKRVSNSKSDLHGHSQGHWYGPFDRPHTISY